MKKVLLLAFVFLTAISTNVNAQNFLGYRQSNYSGVVGADLNPAAIADSRFVVDVTLFGVGVQGYNNWAYMNTHKMPYWWSQSFNTEDAAVQAWQDEPDYGTIVPKDSVDAYFNSNRGNFFEFDNPRNKARAAYFAAEVDILNFMVSINPKMAFSMGMKSRTFLNIDHVSSDLITLGLNGLEYSDLWDVDLDDQLLNMSFNSWIEYNAGFAMVLYDEEDHFIKAGAKLKFLQGLGSFYLYTKNVDYSVFNR